MNCVTATWTGLLVGGVFFAQAQENNGLRISGYAEVYYQRDFNVDKSNQRPNFIYSHNRNNEVSLNLGLVKASYETERMRTNLGIGVGSYMSANYAAEPDVLKNIYEANLGVRLSSTHELWLDVGILPSHIGFESAEGMNCPTLTRSIMAENSPYFETGAKLSYQTRNKRWQMALLALNGWQRIQRVDGNTTPAFGHQLTFRASERLTFNSSSFVGSDKPDSTRQMRYFHNLYGQYQWNEKINFIAGFDIGAEQCEKGSNQYQHWYTAALIMQYRANARLAFAGRAEYYKDRNGVIIAVDDPRGMEAVGGSVNADYHILPNVVWRTEVKNLVLRDGPRWSATTALAVRF
ncbi:porin [Sphingobacterium yanglingense]|uniref:Putative OmpL-like beta-barrel porin-2 n=1 Tax=Sphingobacterium yanglingense TaxID=1437280 RepID=A0A4R6WDL6_9SPHI|nr:porin [Sphingobacterium yanglingense]TDQ77859.1 putative OmpL-like beta-barrel porin-2 [Sphingobacterium yanglingense]